MKIAGLGDLLHDAVERTSLLVQGAQESAARRTYAVLEEIAPLAGAVHAVQRAMTSAVHSSIRGVNDGVRALSSLLPGELSSPGWDRAQAALNGLYGDTFRQLENGAEIEPGFYDRGCALRVERAALSLARPRATGKICILVHGLGCTEHEWTPADGEHFGEKLTRDLGYTCYTFRYNTGLPVCTNGRALAELICQLVREHPVPVEEIALIGHSMGGLVARSAAHEGLSWQPLLRHVVCLGSPHGGAPLEKAVHFLATTLGSFEAAGAKVPSQFLEGRSAGIRDLRHGPEIPSVETATYCYVAASLTRDPRHPLGQILGDALVRLPSASGQSRGRHVSFHFGKVLGGLGHLDLQHHPKVYELLRGWLSEMPV